MTDPNSETVAHIEIRGIQAYVFRTGRLRDTVGRSALVESLTDPLQAPLSNFLSDDVVMHERRSGSFSVRGCDDALHRFVAAYTRYLADTSRELRLVVAYADPTEPNAAALLARARLSQPQGQSLSPLLGVERCALTHGSAEELWSRPGTGRSLPVAGEVLTARKRGHTWHEEFERKVLDPALRLTIPRDIEAIAPSKGESSRMAVIVADVNGLGDLMSQWKASDAAGQERADAGEVLRRCMNELGQHLVATVAGWVKPARDSGGAIKGYRTVGLPEDLRFDLAHGVSDAEEEGTPSLWSLPVAPIILGGDDLALVCESRLALGVACEIVQFFDTAVAGPRADLAALGAPFAADGRITLTFGVGVAIDQVGYSLQRVHDRAVSLMRTAKRRRADLMEWSAPDHHAIALSTQRVDPDRGQAISDETQVYVTTGEGMDAWLAQQRRVDTQPLNSLLTLLDPLVDGGLRSNAPAEPEQPAPWGEQRSWLKSELARSIRSWRTATSDQQREEIRESISQQLSGQGPAVPLLSPVVAESELRLLSDALVLLDEHLTVPPPLSISRKGEN